MGNLMVAVDTPKQYSHIDVTLWGGASVKWTESQNQSSVTFRNGDTIVDAKVTVWRQTRGGSLPAGEHYFPFNFQLPLNIPPSFEGQYGSIHYELQARIMQSDGSKARHVSGTTLKTRHRLKHRPPYQTHNTTTNPAL